MTHFAKCDALFQVWPIFPSVTNIFKCDPFLQVIHYFQYDPLFQMWPIFPSVTHYSKCDQFFQMWPSFSTVTHFSKDIWPIFPGVTHFLSVTHYSKCNLFFYVWPIFPSVTHFSECYPFFNSVNHYSKGDPDYQMNGWSFLCSENCYNYSWKGSLNSILELAFPTVICSLSLRSFFSVSACRSYSQRKHSFGSIFAACVPV